LISEIKVMRMLNSRWIVALKDVLETANNYYIVQEYCDGGTLRDLMLRQKTVPEKQAVGILAQICQGFIELIKNGVIHRYVIHYFRDVKPENILIHNQDYKIADFGFAKNVRSAGQLNKSLVGTPLYMAPQLLRMEKYSTKCDIWAIGMIFYEMLMGEVPWPARTEFELINNIEKRPLMFSHKVGITPHARSFIEGCLKINEYERF
jgi:serine/threonine protein kinase